MVISAGTSQVWHSLNIYKLIIIMFIILFIIMCFTMYVYLYDFAARFDINKLYSMQGQKWSY